MARPVSAASKAGAALPGIRPHWLVAIYLSSGTLRLSSRGTQTFGGQQYQAAGLEVTSESIKIYNAAELGALAKIQTDRRAVTIDIWEAFGPGPFLDDDFDYLYSGEAGRRTYGDWITIELRYISSKPEPHIYILPPTFNHLPPKQAVFLTPTGKETLPEPPSASSAPRPPAQQYSSPTIPGWVPPVAPASVINTQGTAAEFLVNNAAEGAVVPVHYGAFQFGGLPFAVSYDDGTWTVGYVVGIGEIESIDSVWINGASPVSGVVINQYLGTDTQAADPLLVASISEYSDTLVHNDDGVLTGIAYIVIQYTNSHYPTWPSVVIQGKGRKVLNPGTSEYAYSDSPALALYDWISNIMGATIDATSTAHLAASNAETVVSEPRRIIGLTIDRAQPPEYWIEILRTYAGAFVWKRGDTWHVLEDRPVDEASIRTLTPKDFKRFDLTQLGLEQAPTVVRCGYTDTSTGGLWKTEEIPSEDPGVSTGITPRVPSQVRLPGIHRATQAIREANERREKLALALQFQGEAFSDVFDLEFGQVVKLSGFTRWLSDDTLFRLTAQPRRTAQGYVRLVGTEYSASVYDDSEDSTTPGGGKKVIGSVTNPSAGQDGISAWLSMSAPTVFRKAANGGGWSHTSADATITFKRGATVLAVHVLRATLNEEAGTISVATQGTPTGESTSATLPGAAAATVLASVALTSSGVSYPVSFSAVEGGAQGGTGPQGPPGNSESVTARWGGQWGAFGDLDVLINQDLAGANDGEIVFQGADGEAWTIFGPGMTVRTTGRDVLATCWEGSTVPAGNVFYVVSSVDYATTRFPSGTGFVAKRWWTCDYDAGVWTAYGDYYAGGVTFTPLSTDVVVGVGYKSSVTGGIDHYTPLTAGMSLDEAAAAVFLQAAAISTALIKDAAITDAKVANLNAAKITAGLLSAARIDLDGITLVNDAGTLVIGTADWTTHIGGAGKPDDYATQNRNSYEEDFRNTTLAKIQAVWSVTNDIGGEESLVTDATSPIGSYCWQLGNNSGDDEVSRVVAKDRAVPIVQDQLYIIEAVVKRVSGSGTFYLGVAGLGSDGATWVNLSGANGSSSQHYFGANGVTPTLGEWVVYRGYFKRTGSAAAHNYPTTANAPGILHANAAMACPLFFANYNNAAGQYRIAYVCLRPADSPPGLLANLDQVDSGDIVDAAITTTKIANLAVNTAKIADLAVTAGKIGDLEVDTLKIANDAVTLAYYSRVTTDQLPSVSFVLKKYVDLTGVVVPDVDGTGSTTVPVLVTWSAMTHAESSGAPSVLWELRRVQTSGSGSGNATLLSVDIPFGWNTANWSYPIRDDVLPGTYSYELWMRVEYNAFRLVYDCAIEATFAKK